MLIANSLLIVLSLYALFTLALWYLWKRIGTAPRGGYLRLPEDGTYWASVVIPVRNEAANIEFLLEDLERQILPKSCFEVFVVDDGSTDGTAQKVEAYRRKSALDLHLVRQDNSASSSPKKKAIETAVAMGKGRLVITTDGDCRVKPGWLEAFVRYRQSTEARCISGPVTFTPEEKLTDYMQTVEFASLIGGGAGAIEAGFPTMCNGANLAYDREAFYEVGGFSGVAHTASGDDEFLLHKIAGRYPGKIGFLKDEEAIVQTLPHRRWSDFVKQRQRWASKWKHYKSPAPKVLAVFVFVCNAFFLAGVLGAVAGVLDGYLLLRLSLLKILPEWLFIGAVLRFLGKRHTLWCIPVVQVVYPLYVAWFGLKGQEASYEWKGRTLR